MRRSALRTRRSTPLTRTSPASSAAFLSSSSRSAPSFSSAPSTGTSLSARYPRHRPRPRRPAPRQLLKQHARAVVIGGGVGGASILYWLTRLGWKDVVLLERAQVTSGSTFHSAGLVGQLRGSLSLTRMMMNSVELYRALQEETGRETGWHEVGSLRLASSPERMQELTRQAAWAKTFGLPLELVS